MKNIKFRMKLNNGGVIEDVESVMRCISQQQIFDVNPSSKAGYDHISDGCEFQQFTGLKDTNDLEIFEGDLLEIKNCLNIEKAEGIVFFYDGTFCLKRISQSESAKRHGYVDRIKLWNSGDYDHYSLEILDYFDMKIL